MPHPSKTGFNDVRDEVIRRIQDGIWPQGSLLPAETALAEEFGCARATVNRALRELAEQGIVDRKRKSGTRVNRTPVKQAKFEISIVRRTIEDQNAIYRYALIQKTQRPCPRWLAARLDLPDRQPMLYLECLHLADNRPFQFEERWINIAAVPGVLEADFSQTGPNEWLLGAVPFSNAEIGVSAVSADERLSEFLATPPGTALFQLERMTWFRGEPITFVQMTHHPGYQMRSRY